jgi:hypothetical protein
MPNFRFSTLIFTINTTSIRCGGPSGNIGHDDDVLVKKKIIEYPITADSLAPAGGLNALDVSAKWIVLKMCESAFNAQLIPCG